MKRWEYKIINLRSEKYRLDPAFTPALDTPGQVGSLFTQPDSWIRGSLNMNRKLWHA